MAAPAFGFSAGDLMMAINLVVKVSNALKSTGGASDELKFLSEDLQSLKCLLEELQEMKIEDYGSPSHVNAVKVMALAIQSHLQAFLDSITKFESSLGRSRTANRTHQFTRKVQWAAQMPTEIQKLRSIIMQKIVTLTLLLLVPIG